MSKKSDDSIERIFRQALTQYDISYQESDWVKMEKLLNEEASRKAAARSRRIKGTAFTLTGLTGLIIAVYFLAFRNPSDSMAELNNPATETQATGDLEKEGSVKLQDPSAGLLSQDQTVPGAPSPGSGKNPSANNVSKENSEVEPHTAPGEMLRGDGTGPPKETERPTTPVPTQPAQDDVATDQGARQKSSAIALDANQQVPGGGVNAAPASRENNDSPGDGNRPLNEPPVSGNDMQGTFLQPNERGKMLPETGAAVIAGSSGNGGADPASPESEKTVSVQGDSLSNSENIPTDVAADSLQDSKAGDKQKQKIKPSYRWSVGAIFAPEFTSTSFGNYSAPGASIGLRVGYQISNKLNVKTGIIRSTKKYEGDGYDYSPRNPLYWQIRTNGMIPEEIDGECLVYELPIGVQFDVIQTQKSRVFVSAAISSYFMVSQSYDYTFGAPNPGADTGWNSSRSETYWFDAGMISAGYERYVQRSFAIGIEPYLKASFGEIGWPNVKLVSAGAYVTLRYRFMSQKNIQ